MAALLSLLPSLSFADDPIRVASFATPLSREGPGLLLRDIQTGEDSQIDAAHAVIDHIAPDILLLTDIDYDAGLLALAAFNAGLAQPYPHLFARSPNTGVATGLDMDGNGRIGEPRDAQGYGRFLGDGGMAILSRYPFGPDVQDFSTMLWRDLPGAILPMVDDQPFPSAGAQAVQRLSSSGHWIVPVDTPLGQLSLWAFSATPPVFDGPEDRNGLRNRDELRLWEQVLAGRLGEVALDSFVVLGNANLDPADGDGYREAMVAFLDNPRLQDPRPASAGGALAQSPRHLGDPALDTADWDEGGPGNLRVTYVLPSVDWTVTASGVFWPAPDDPNVGLLGEDGLAAGPHRLVWVDILR